MIIVIVGPTGVGKTKLSLELAKRLNGEIINADSTQMYQGLDIATAKVKDKEGITHHLIDLKNINEDYSVYDYQKDARNCIDDILKRNKTPIMVGGTGLYIKAALYNYEFKEMIKKDYSSYSNEELLKKVKDINPETTIHVNNRRRLESYLNNNSNHKTDELLYDTLFIGLTTGRDKLYDLINKRVDYMIKEGLIDEAKAIYDLNIRSKAVMTPIGYKELFLYFDHKISLESAIELIKQHTRNYAKRQYTWFNHQVKVTWFNVNFDHFEETINEVLDYIKKKLF